MSTAHDLLAQRYRLVRQVGSGGMGVVWEAWDERLERTVAVKQLRKQVGIPDADAELAKNRAMREARITARLHHRHAVPVFDVVEHDGQPCLVMQFLPSVPLSNVLREGGPLDVHESAQVGAQVASALAAAHQLDIVHRDVKPGNILIADDGSALISDFGISHALGDATLTSTGLVHGTPAYLAPEVARGAESSFASDVFSLGATLYTTLEGSPPFGTDSNSIALLHKVAAGEFAAPRRAGPLEPVLLEMLATDPAARPPMREVATRLAGLAQSTAPAAATVPLPLQPSDRDAAAPTTGYATAGPAAAPVGTAGAAGTAAEESQPTLAVRRPLPAPVEPAPPAPPAGPRSTPATAPRRRRTLAVLVTLVALLALGLGAAALVRAQQGGGDPTTADPVTTGAPSATPSDADPSSATPRPSPTPTPTPTPSRTRTPSPTPSRTPTPSPTPTRGDGRPTAAELAAAVRDYYGLVPGNTDQAWQRLTSRYQSGTAGGRRSFDQFWGSIQRVRVSDTGGDPPNGAEATVTYTFDDGRVVVEKTSYQLVEDDGVLKIDASTPITSTTR